MASQLRRGSVPDARLRSESQSENRRSSSGLARTASISLMAIRSARPPTATQMAPASSWAASRRMPSIEPSSDSTVRRKTSTLSALLSIAACSCLRRSSSVPSIWAIRSQASAARSPQRPRAIWTIAIASRTVKARAQDQSARMPNQMGPSRNARLLNVHVKPALPPICSKVRAK